MKKILFLPFLFCNLLLVAQPPSGYYNTATGTGYTLKAQLHTIIKNSHVPQTYGQIWTLYTDSAFRDSYYENNNTLLDFYSEKPSGSDAYEYSFTTQQCGGTSATQEGFCYNREHIIPQSYFDNFQEEPMKSDVFHVFPSDAWVNSQRGNFPFGVVNNPTYTSSNGSKKGNNSNTGYATGYSSTVFEPIDEFKGDVARAFFYFVTRYEENLLDFYNSNTFIGCPAKYMFDGTLNKSFTQPFLNILYQWHIQDPVSAKEIAQNNAIFNHQGNRNPYIDNPQWITTVWSSNLNLTPFTENKIKIFPNPVTESYITLETNFKINEINIFSANGSLVKTLKNPILKNNLLNIEELNKGIYFLKINTENELFLDKLIIQ